MDKQAVIATGGKQYLVSAGEILVVDKLKGKEKDLIKFSQVLLVVDKNLECRIGTPYLKGAVVQAQILKHDRGEKIRVARFKAKSRHRKVKGFRAELTQIKIKKIVNK